MRIALHSNGMMALSFNSSLAEEENNQSKIAGLCSSIVLLLIRTLGHSE